jgi:hydrogenase maturation protease
MRSLLLGLGNPILGGDGIGIHVARVLEGTLEGVEVATTATMDLEVLDLLAGYGRAFLIDAMCGSGRSVGEVELLRIMEPELFPYSTHAVSFFDLLSLGEVLGYRLPEMVGIFGIEIGHHVSFGEEVPPELLPRVQSIADTIARHIRSEISHVPSEISP